MEIEGVKWMGGGGENVRVGGGLRGWGVGGVAEEGGGCYEGAGGRGQSENGKRPGAHGTKT